MIILFSVELTRDEYRTRSRMIGITRNHTVARGGCCGDVAEMRDV